MPTAFTHTPLKRRKPRKTPGTGGKPPVTRRPTGGGGGGGDDGWDNQGHGPRELLAHCRLIVFSALAVDLIFFAALAIVVFASQANAYIGPRIHESAGNWHPLPRILFLNTVLLAASCLTMELARRKIFREIDVLEEWLGMGKPALRNTLPWLGATLGLGALFLAGQALAWKQLTERGLASWAAPFPSFFFAMAGLHTLHLLAGLLALLLCLSTLSWLKRVEFRQIAVDATAWYWQTISLTWLFLLAVLAFGQS